MDETEVMISADALRKQIKKVKRCFHSENSNYMTGYLSALSMVEGLIAYLTEPTNLIAPMNTVFEDKEDSGLLEE